MKCFSMIVLSGALALPAGAMLVAAPSQGHIVANDEVQAAQGEIVRVDADRNTFVLATGEDGNEITLRVTERTQYTLNGEKSTMDEALRQGHEADVRHRNNLAIKVDATSESDERILFASDDIQVAEGEIKSVDSERNRFILSIGEGGEEITLRVTERTQYTLNGEESTMDEALQEGHQANVRHRNNLAIQVDATTEAE